MRRVCGIGYLVAFVCMACAGVVLADDFVEDVYYWPSATPRNTNEAPTPHYSSRAKEIIFIEDSSASQHPDTVRAIIRDVKPSEYNRQN